MSLDTLFFASACSTMSRMMCVSCAILLASCSGLDTVSGVLSRNVSSSF